MKASIILPTHDITNCKATMGYETQIIPDIEITVGKESHNHTDMELTIDDESNDVPDAEKKSSNENTKEDKFSKNQEENHTYGNRLAEIQEKINGIIGIDLSKVSENIIDDIFDLSSSPEIIKKGLFQDRKPIKISVASYIKLPSCKQIFRFYMWFGFSKAPVIEDMPRRFIDNPEIWIRKFLMDYPRMTETVVKYLSDALKKVLPILDKKEYMIQEDRLMEEILEKVVEEVRERELPDDTTGASQYKIIEIKDSDGKEYDYACICGSDILKKLLAEIDSPYSSKQFLEFLDNWEDGSLLKKNGKRKDYKFKSSDSKRWYCIRIISKNASEEGECHV